MPHRRGWREKGPGHRGHPPHPSWPGRGPRSSSLLGDLTQPPPAETLTQLSRDPEIPVAAWGSRSGPRSSAHQPSHSSFLLYMLRPPSTSLLTPSGFSSVKWVSSPACPPGPAFERIVLTKEVREQLSTVGSTHQKTRPSLGPSPASRRASASFENGGWGGASSQPFPAHRVFTRPEYENGALVLCLRNGIVPLVTGYKHVRAAFSCPHRRQPVSIGD